MARKPNYGFERRERERQKAEKKAARLEARRAKSAAKRDGADNVVVDENGNVVEVEAADGGDAGVDVVEDTNREAE